MAGEIGVRIIKNDLPQLINILPSELDKRINALAEHGVTIVKTSMESSPAGGRTSSRGSRTHTSAIPGNPPRPDTATLINSIMSQRVRTMVHRIYTQVEYARYLEFGSARWDSGVTFPFMGPMALELEGLIPEFFEDFLE